MRVGIEKAYEVGTDHWKDVSPSSEQSDEEEQ